MTGCPPQPEGNQDGQRLPSRVVCGIPARGLTPPQVMICNVVANHRIGCPSCERMPPIPHGDASTDTISAASVGGATNHTVRVKPCRLNLKKSHSHLLDCVAPFGLRQMRWQPVVVKLLLNIVALGRACTLTPTKLLINLSRVKDEEILARICAQSLNSLGFLKSPKEF